MLNIGSFSVKKKLKTEEQLALLIWQAFCPFYFVSCLLKHHISDAEFVSIANLNAWTYQSKF